jgi:hypothetical protein
MKSTAAPVVTAIRSAHEVKALPKAIAEWNWNRYAPVIAVSNTPAEVDEGFDIEAFPLESIIEPQRPKKGASKALVGHSQLADDYHTPRDPRFHVVSVDDKYKYWIGPYQSNGAGVISGVNPTVMYNQGVTPIATNKIQVTVENSWASPAEYQIQVTTNGGSAWVNIGTPPVANDGTLTMWWNGTAWQATQPSDISATTQINGVRFVVTRLTGGRRIDGTPTQYKSPATNSVNTTNGANTWFSLIEISARRVMDISSRITSVDDQFDAGEASHLLPMGGLTTNSATIRLWNGPDGAGLNNNIFSTENTSSTLYGLIEPNAQITLWFEYDIAPSKYRVQQFTMFVDEWAEGSESEVSVSLSDESKYLKEVKPRACKYEKQTVAQLVYHLCDNVGFSNYNVANRGRATEYKIPVWWTDGEETLWEIFDELAQATQTLIYFDAYGVLQVKTREDAYDRTATPVWNLRAVKSGTDLPDIVNLEQTDTYEANTVKIIYKATKWADEVNGFPQYSTVWTPEDTTVLRASALLNQLNPGDTHIKIAPEEAKIWPYEGMVQINGEAIRYDAKMFNYREGGVWKSRAVTDQADMEKYDALTTATNGRFLNHFDGRLRISLRGEWNTEVDTHRVDANGYSVARFGPSDYVGSNAGFTHHRQTSTVSLTGGGRLNGPQDFMVATRGGQGDTGWRHIGTRMKFNPGNHVDQRAGLVFNVVGQRGGYYVEFTPTAMLSTKERQTRKEIGFYTITGLQPNTKIPSKGAEATIIEDRWFNVDIYFGWDNQRVAIWVDGKKYIDITVPAGQQFSPNGKFGMFIRGRSEAEFEYLYALARQSEPVPLDDFSAIRQIDGWHDGLNMYKEWKFKWKKKKKSNKPRHRRNFQFMDEFGPFVHEIREFDVKFDPAPVQYSKIYSTNEDNAMLIDYRGSSFGAKFTMANAGRFHSVVHGEDTLTFPGVDGKAINRQLIVYGRALVVGEDEEVVVKNDRQVRARGEITTELDSRWIQDKSTAEALGKWITNHWGVTADQLQVQVFGNPLFEVGDLVAIDYPSKSMGTSSHQYFVTGISSSFSEGLSTSLTLQRKN